MNQDTAKSEQIERVKHLRKNLLGLSQEEFGKRLGVSKGVIVNIEVGRVDLKEMMVNLICRTFNVNPLWLTDGIGDPKSEISESLLDDLAVEYNLSEIEKRIVSNFIKLPADERQQVISLIKKLIT